MQSLLAWVADIAAGACGWLLLTLAFWGEGLGGGERAACSVIGALIVWRSLFRPAA